MNSINRLIRIGIAFVWLINGLYCKVMGAVPRHEAIVARILGEEYGGILTRMIGVLEIMMCVWVLSRVRPTLCVMVQIVVILIMNMLEFLHVPDLLLFGRFNLIMALGFIGVIYWNQLMDRTYPKVQKEIL
jgi:hypothetical protein